MKKPQIPAATPAQEQAVAPDVKKQVRKKAAPKNSKGTAIKEPEVPADYNPIFVRWQAAVANAEIEWAKAGIQATEVRGRRVWSVKDVQTAITETFSNPKFRFDSINAYYHEVMKAGLEYAQQQVAAAPVMLSGDTERRKVLVDAFELMADTHRDALAEIAALNRLFAGVTDQRPAGPYADYRLWTIVLHDGVAPPKKEGQELVLNSVETLKGHNLTVRFGYRVPMPNGQDGMVCYAMYLHHAMKIKAGDRIFAPYNAA
jgi:hypothetical protein